MTSVSRFCALTLSAALSLTIVTAPASAQTTALTPMRIANLGFTEASALPVYAQAAGIFKKYGIDATITTFNGGGAIIAAIAGGSLDAGFSNITSAVAAIQKGIPILIFSAANLTAAGHADALLMKARGSKLKTGADLNGKTIAVTTLGGTLQLGAEAVDGQKRRRFKNRALHRSPVLQHARRIEARTDRRRDGLRAIPQRKQSRHRTPRRCLRRNRPAVDQRRLRRLKSMGHRKPRRRPPLRSSDARNRPLGQHPPTQKQQRFSRRSPTCR